MYTKFKLFESGVGYNVRKYLYHVTPLRKMDFIEKNGLIPQDGISIKGEEYDNRLYFATSLIAAYDISVNFGSYKDDSEYVIFKVDSKCLKGYENDPLFVHGIYVDYPISKNYIVDVIEADSLFNKFDDDDLDNLYL